MTPRHVGRGGVCNRSGVCSRKTRKRWWLKRPGYNSPSPHLWVFSDRERHACGNRWDQGWTRLVSWTRRGVPISVVCRGVGMNGSKLVARLSGECSPVRLGGAAVLAQARVNGERDITMFGSFPGLQRRCRPVGCRSRPGDTGGRSTCHTLLSHEIFVRSASAGNFQQTAPGGNTVHLTAHNLTAHNWIVTRSHVTVDSLGVIGESRGARSTSCPTNLVRTALQSRNTAWQSRCKCQRSCHRSIVQPVTVNSISREARPAPGFARPAVGPLAAPRTKEQVVRMHVLAEFAS